MHAPDKGKKEKRNPYMHSTINGGRCEYTGWSKKTEWPTSAILMQKPITISDRIFF